MSQLIAAHISPVTIERRTKGNKTKREQSLRIDLTYNNGTSSHENVAFDQRK
jgi:hypothetical protein